MTDHEKVSVTLGFILTITLLLILYLAYKKDTALLGKYHDTLTQCHEGIEDQHIKNHMNEHDLSHDDPEHRHRYRTEILYPKISAEKSTFSKICYSSAENGLRGAAFGIITGTASALSGGLLFATIPTIILWGKDNIAPQDTLIVH